MASSRVGLLGTRNMLLATGVTTATARRIAGPAVTAWRVRSPCTTSPTVRWYAVPKVRPVDWSPPSPSAQGAEANSKDTTRMLSAADVGIVLPGTLVAPPLPQYPRKPREFFKFLYEVVKTYARTRAGALGMSFSSKPSFFKKARYRLNNPATLLTAKAMHRTMNEALAMGDKQTLNNICTSRMSNPLMAAIDARPNNRRYAWELVRYNGSWRNPRMASQMLVPTTRDASGPLLRQVVVSIKSRQRRVEQARKGGRWEDVPGTAKEMDVTENLVLVALIHPKTWAQGEWRILGTVPTMTAEDWYAEKEMVSQLEQQEFSKTKAR